MSNAAELGVYILDQVYARRRLDKGSIEDQPRDHMNSQERRAIAERINRSHDIDIHADDAEKVFARLIVRPVCRNDGTWLQEVFYQDRWLRVGHTSLVDDVATSLCADSPESAMKVCDLAPKCYGVRVHDDYVSFITHMTDG